MISRLSSNLCVPVILIGLNPPNTIEGRHGLWWSSMSFHRGRSGGRHHHRLRLLTTPSYSQKKRFRRGLFGKVPKITPNKSLERAAAVLKLGLGGQPNAQATANWSIMASAEAQSLVGRIITGAFSYWLFTFFFYVLAPGLRRNRERTGLTHLTMSSGLHCAHK